MGKVGSTSIAKSLMMHMGRFSIFTSHFMNDPGHPRSVVLYEKIIRSGKPVKIITLVRDPISKNISSFFQDFEKNTGISYSDSDFDMAELTSIFLDKFDHSSPLVWLDENIHKYLGIDVYSLPFPTNKGAIFFRSGDVELLVMRCELDNASKEKYVSDFLGLDDFRIHNKNIGSQKSYSDTYKAFKKAINLPVSYVDKMTSSKYFKHFYTESEIQALRQKWLRI